MENQQNKMYEYDVNDAELNKIYEAILRQQAVGTDEGRKNWFLYRAYKMMQNFN